MAMQENYENNVNSKTLDSGKWYNALNTLQKRIPSLKHLPAREITEKQIVIEAIKYICKLKEDLEKEIPTAALMAKRSRKSKQKRENLKKIDAVYQTLRERVPNMPANATQEMTLNGTIEYIKHLTAILAGDKLENNENSAQFNAKQENQEEVDQMAALPFFSGHINQNNVMILAGNELENNENFAPFGANTKQGMQKEVDQMATQPFFSGNSINNDVMMPSEVNHHSGYMYNF